MILMKALWRVRGLTLSTIQRSEMQTGPVMLRADSSARHSVTAAGPRSKSCPPRRAPAEWSQNHFLKLLRGDVQIAMACGIEHRNKYLPDALDLMVVRLKGFSPARQNCVEGGFRQ